MIGVDFEHFCAVVEARSGIALNSSKTYLVQSRLEPIARELGLADVPGLLTRLRTGAPDALVRRCVDAMATHESLFFRDSTPFTQLETIVLPALVRARSHDRPLKIWCAACSSGQEPYSIGILMQEQAGLLGGRRVEIFATDMSEGILEKAREGLYTDFEARRGLSPERLKRWFTRRAGDYWQVSQSLQQMVTFKAHNLLEAAPRLGPFDIIFCRNVLIYFDPPRKTQVLEQIGRVLALDGSLFLGSAETIIGLSASLTLTPGARGVYTPITTVAA